MQMVKSKNVLQDNTDTHGLLLWCRLLLRSGLLLGGCLLLGSRLLLRCDLLGLGGSLFEISAELVGALDLGEDSIGDGLLQGVQEHGVEPLLVGREVGLHVLLDGDGGGTVAVLEGRDGLDDFCFVRHGDDWIGGVGKLLQLSKEDGWLRTNRSEVSKEMACREVIGSSVPTVTNDIRWRRCKFPAAVAYNANQTA